MKRIESLLAQIENLLDSGLVESPHPDRMSILNAFKLDRELMWQPKGKQLITCKCGWSDGFRVFPEGAIAKAVQDHNKVCELLEGRDRSRI